jgi:WD40 repeat protein
LATISKDHTAKIWDLQRGKALLIFNAARKDKRFFFSGAAFSPDGQRLVTLSDFYTLEIWDLRNGKVILELEDEQYDQYNQDNISSFAFSPDGQKLATGSDDLIKLWDLSTGKAMFRLEGHDDEVFSIVFLPDGQSLVTSADDTIKVWNLVSPQQISSNGVSIKTAALSTRELSDYNLENLLDQKPNNEAKLIATGEIWQIFAFAQLYADKIAFSIPHRVDYERAKRLYQACLNLPGYEDYFYFKEKLAELEKAWKERGE